MTVEDILLVTTITTWVMATTVAINVVEFLHGVRAAKSRAEWIILGLMAPFVLSGLGLTAYLLVQLYLVND